MENVAGWFLQSKSGDMPAEGSGLREFTLLHMRCNGNGISTLKCVQAT